MQRQWFYKAFREGKNVKPISAFEKNYVLGVTFKNNAKKQSKDENLASLKILAEVRLDNEHSSYEKRRKTKHKSNKLCLVCKKNRAHYQHHMILLKHGGYDNSINRIPICDDCHVVVHPWLK